MPTRPELAGEMVALYSRNQKAHKELVSLNDNGKFLFIHPLTLTRQYTQTLTQKLETLKNSEPIKFQEEIANTIQNIRRIESNLKRKKYKSEEEKTKWEENLERAKIKQQVLSQIL